MSYPFNFSYTFSLIPFSYSGGSGGGSTPPEPSSEINYYANDGSTLLLTIPLTPTFTGTLYNQPIDFGG